MDALLLDQIGLKQAVAVGKAGLTEAHARTIAGCGIRRGIICFGSGPDKDRLTESARGLLESKNIETAVLPMPDDYTDLDHFIRATDLHDFKKLLRKVRKPRK